MQTEGAVLWTDRCYATMADSSAVGEDQVSALGDMIQMEDAPGCNICGSLMIRSGTCYRCGTCGSTSVVLLNDRKMAPITGESNDMLRHYVGPEVVHVREAQS